MKTWFRERESEGQHDSKYSHRCWLIIKQTTALHHVVDMPISFPEPVILSLRWTRVNKGSGEKIAGNIHGAIFTPESTETKMASLQTQK